MSIRSMPSKHDSVYILNAVVEALGISSDDCPINKSSIQRIRTETRKLRTAAITSGFRNNVPDVVIGMKNYYRVGCEMVKRRTLAVE